MSGSAKFKIGDIVIPSAITLNDKTGKIMNMYWQQLNNGLIIEIVDIVGREEIPPQYDESILYGVYWDIGMIDYSLAREIELVSCLNSD